jgi:hypothetical protein
MVALCIVDRFYFARCATVPEIGAVTTEQDENSQRKDTESGHRLFPFATEIIFRDTVIDFRAMDPAFG